MKKQRPKTTDDRLHKILDATSSSGSTVLATTALSLALLTLQYSVPTQDQENFITRSATPSTNAQPLSQGINSIDVFREINRIYDELLHNQVALDPDSHRALYANLWDLYSA